MRREEVSKIRLAPQFAPHLGKTQFGKNTLGLQPQRQKISDHFNQQRRVQTVTL